MAAGVVIGAGACYCVYRLTWGRDESEKIWDDHDDDEEEESSDIAETGKELRLMLGQGLEPDFRVTQRPRLRCPWNSGVDLM